MSIVTGAKTVYPTKRDVWLVVVLWAAVIVMLISVGVIWKEPETLAFRLGVAVLFVALAVFILWVLYSTHYTLTDRNIIIRSGPFRWTIPLDSIIEIYPTHNPLSSPALVKRAALPIPVIAGIKEFDSLWCPIIDTRKIETAVRVRSGQKIVLGGISRNQGVLTSKGAEDNKESGDFVELILLTTEKGKTGLVTGPPKKVRAVTPEELKNRE